MKTTTKASSFYNVFERKGGPHKETTHYCPGCGHGNVHKMIAEAMDDLGINEKTVFVSPVGCSVFGYYYFDCGNFQAAHGRAPAVATGIKRANPDSIVISYQGDGDLAAIGTAETLHAANRGENITVFFVNNAIYGMTGGQMAPTTLIQQKTATTPRGRIEAEHGNPIKMAEIISTLPAATYVERVAIGNSKHIMKARKAIRKALKNQVENRGYSFVEILSVCPTGWKMDSPDARDWLTDQMIEAFPLGVYKDESSEREDSWYRGIKPFVPSELNKYFGVNAEADVVPVDLKKDLFCKFAGFGGQGILTMGLFLAQIGMRADHHVSWIPAYGPEMRGGTANCSVNVSSNRIGTPLVERPNVMVAMNLPSLEMFEKDVVDGGVILVDSGIVDKTPDTDRLDVVMIPATKIADEVGTPKVANVVMLGAMIAATDAYSMDFVSDTLKIVVKKKNLIDMNLAALQRGYDFVKNGS
ncbi:2-ketoisovalerate ferredoxin oxidoreductase [bacterium]|jgi:2-oxoisovalerate ferredoxin oxidoreductase beta subunit|nr:2-ketoisovalerate ferredoxin oxidoreductase [bacterium]MBT7311033.1 2-ketoisovalerate ferredoxin oxidoreductase [bacterium]